VGEGLGTLRSILKFKKKNNKALETKNKEDSIQKMEENLQLLEEMIDRQEKEVKE